MKRIGLGLRVAAAAALFFVLTAAPGGGGHGGGFSGGVSFHGGGISSFHSSGGSSSGSSSPVGMIVGMTAFAALIGWVVALEVRRRQKVLLVLAELPDGARVVPELDTLVAEADFASPQGRVAALARLSVLLDAAPIDSSAVRVFYGPAIASAPGPEAERLYRAQLRAAGIREWESAQLREAREKTGVRPQDACVIGIVATVPAGRVKAGAKPLILPEAMDLLKSGGAPFALYFFHAPDPGQPLDPTTARELVRRLKESAGAFQPTPTA